MFTSTRDLMSGHKNDTCPFWVGYLLINPMRNLYQNPKRILEPYIREGMTVLDYGCAMGFFSLPMARMVGPGGKVIAVDIQEKMLRTLVKRAKKAGLANRIETHLAVPGTIGLEGYQEKIDFILALAVVHEVPDPVHTFTEFHSLLKARGKLLLAEPKGHVTRENFEATLAMAEKSGFTLESQPKIFRSRTALMRKS